MESINEIHCGNLVYLGGISMYFNKTATLCSEEAPYRIKNLNYSNKLVMAIGVECEEAKDLPKLIEGLR